jgi:ABC-type transport system involved in multi-copper enzyme maturation permease subunit
VSDENTRATNVRLFVRDVGTIARFEIAEAIRSRLLAVMLLLFVGTGALGAWGFSQLLGRIEDNAARVMGTPRLKRPGGTVRQMRESKSYRDMLRVALGDDAKADYYAEKPPLVVFFGWASLLFTPWLILFTSSETIASEVGSRGIRYALLRTGRLTYAVGKFAGQALLLLAVMLLSAVTFFGVAWLTLAGFEAGATALGMLAYLPRVLVYNLPFLAFAFLASMLTASANLARVLSLGGMVGLGILYAFSLQEFADAGPVGQSLWELVRYLSPFAHKSGLSYPPGGALPADVAVCLVLSVLYFAAGYAVLRRRDV